MQLLIQTKTGKCEMWIFDYYATISFNDIVTIKKAAIWTWHKLFLTGGHYISIYAQV